MTVQYDSQSMVILAIKARLLEKIPEAFENNTWIDDAPIPFGKDPPQLNTVLRLLRTTAILIQTGRETRVPSKRRQPLQSRICSCFSWMTPRS